ncbi:hypothetical protein N9755_01390 [bacterium]|nr:hypothetical protein [bacterium]
MRIFNNLSIKEIEYVYVLGETMMESHKKWFDVAKRTDYDLLIKLDDDFEVYDELAFREALYLMYESQDKYFIYPVWDHITKRRIYGVHIHKSGVLFSEAEDTEMPDRTPKSVDEMLMPMQGPCFVEHQRNYSLETYNRYVINRLRRALEALLKLKYRTTISHLNLVARAIFYKYF